MIDSARIVIAPDSFKGTLGARDVATAIRAGWLSARPQDNVEISPQADGGEGTVDAIEASVNGARQHYVPDVSGPDGRKVTGEWLELPDGTGVVEIAQMSGLPLMDQLDPIGATSKGLGEVIASMLDFGISRLVVGLGGSASTDGGLPVLESIGERRPPDHGAVILTDVTSPLLGPDGAAVVFAAQKCATGRQVDLLEQRLRRVADRLGNDPFEPGVGAAGGVAYALRSWGGTLTAGSSYVATVTGLAATIQSADLVLTGEGRYDSQSRTGKVVGKVLDLADEFHVQRGVIAGTAEEAPDCWIATLRGFAGSTEAAIAQPAEWLFVAGRSAAEQLMDPAFAYH